MSDGKVVINLTIHNAEEDGPFVVLTGTDGQMVKLLKEEAASLNTSIGSTLSLQVSQEELQGDVPATAAPADTKKSGKINKRDDR